MQKSFLLTIEEENNEKIRKSLTDKISGILTELKSTGTVYFEEIEPVELNEHSIDYINKQLLEEDENESENVRDHKASDPALQDLTEIQLALVAACLVETYKFDLSELELSSKEWNNFNVKLESIVYNLSKREVDREVSKTIKKVIKEVNKNKSFIVRPLEL